MSDDVGLPTVSIAASDPTATEAGPTGGVFTVTRSGDLSAPLTVFYTVAGTATPSVDYAALSGSVTIVATQASATINVDPLDDADVEPDETVVAALAADAAYTIGAPAQGSVTIESDDVGGLPTVSIAASDPTATEAGPTGGVFTVTRSGDLSAPLTVFYTVAGTATPSVDYAALSGSVTIVATQASATINVDPLDDADVEPDETVVAALAADAAYTIGASAQGAVTIVSDDVGLPTVSIAASDPTATEAGPTGGVFTVTRSGDLSAPLTVFYTVAGTATPSVDYAALSGSVTIVATQASAAINVDPLDDADVEPDETVVAALAADAAYTIGAPAQGAVTIVSDDGGVPLPVDKAEWKGDVVEVEGRGAPGAAEVQVGIVGTSILLGTVVAEADGKWRLSQNRAPNEVPCEVNARTGGGAFDAATAVKNAPPDCVGP